MVSKKSKAKKEPQIIGFYPSVDQLVKYHDGKIKVFDIDKPFMELWKAAYVRAGVVDEAREKFRALDRGIKNQYPTLNDTVVVAYANASHTINAEIEKKVEEKAKKDKKLAELLSEMDKVNSERIKQHHEDIKDMGIQIHLDFVKQLNVRPKYPNQKIYWLI